jgi:hypothetical protein
LGPEDAVDHGRCGAEVRGDAARAGAGAVERYDPVGVDLDAPAAVDGGAAVAGAAARPVPVRVQAEASATARVGAFLGIATSVRPEHSGIAAVRAPLAGRQTMLDAQPSQCGLVAISGAGA